MTAAELQELLVEKKVSSVGLVHLYLAQITKHNHNGAKLNAIISTAPLDDVLKRAQDLDTERGDGKLRGPMHGIPIILKVANIHLPTFEAKCEQFPRIQSLRLRWGWKQPAVHLL